MKFFSILLTVLLLQLCVTAQEIHKPKQTAPETFWLKHNLIFFSGYGSPIVLPDNILFVDGCDGLPGGSVGTFTRGTKVEILSVDKSGKYATLSFKVPAYPQYQEVFELRLKNNSDRNYCKSFELLFSQIELSSEPDYSCANNLKTKKQVLKCLGFPISNCKTGEIEFLYYTLEFAGRGLWGYDTWTIKIHKGKIIDISGTV